MSLFWLLFCVVIFSVCDSETRPNSQQETIESVSVRRDDLQDYANNEFNPTAMLLNSYCYKRFFLGIVSSLLHTVTYLN